jgi:hypothetical protein
VVPTFVVDERVTHDKYGLGRVVSVEGDQAVVVDFGSSQIRLMRPASVNRSDDLVTSGHPRTFNLVTSGHPRSFGVTVGVLLCFPSKHGMFGS